MGYLSKAKLGEPKYKEKNLFLLFVAVIYSATCIYVYNSYKNELQQKIKEVLNDSYKIILDNSALRLEHIIHRFPTDKAQNSQITIDKTDIRNCHSDKCYKINLLEFISEIGKYVPSFINYKIEINRQLLDSNNKLSTYQLEKTHNINQYNQIIIGLSIDESYTSIIEQNIARPYIMSIVSVTVLMLVAILYSTLINKKIKNFYFGYFQSEYESLYRNLEEQVKSEVDKTENKLLKKIWDLEYRNDKDIELNRLFSEEANRLTLIVRDDEPGNSDKTHTGDNSLCTLNLYIKNQGYEKIKIQNLVQTFTDRFVESSEYINFEIKSDIQDVKFSSKAWLYQIIYSIIFYLSFMLKAKSPNHNHNIRLDISERHNAASLLFRFDGKPITNEDDLTKLSFQFLKKHINPFVLSVAQIFDTLRDAGFDCMVFCEESNFIRITRHAKLKQNTEDNVVVLRPKRD